MGLADPIMGLADPNSRVIFGRRDRSDVTTVHIYNAYLPQIYLQRHEILWSGR